MHAAHYLEGMELGHSRERNEYFAKPEVFFSFFALALHEYESRSNVE